MQFKTVLGVGVMTALTLTVDVPAIAQSVSSTARNACIVRTAEEMGVATRDVLVNSAGPVSAESGAVTLSMRNSRTKQTAECRVNTIDNTVLSVTLGRVPATSQSVSSTARNACIVRTAEEMGVATRDVFVTRTGRVSAESGAATLSMLNSRTKQTAECRVNTIDNTVLSVNLGRGNAGGSRANTNTEFWVVVSRTFLKESPGIGSKTVNNNVRGGTVLRNLGCQRQTLPTWCEVEFRNDPSIRGWAWTPNLRRY